MYQPRVYRDKMSANRFSYFTVCYKETDLLIGVDKASSHKEVEQFVINAIISLRNELEKYKETCPEFFSSLTPIILKPDYPQMVSLMSEASAKAGIGPMGSVAGAFAEYIGKLIKDEYKVKEVIVENGGDIYLDIYEPVIVSVYAGKSKLSEKIGVIITPEYSPLGVCTSSGTIGHSLSFGKADAVMIICRSTLLADAWATALANKVFCEKDIEKVLNDASNINDIKYALIIKNDKIGIVGKFKLKLVAIRPHLQIFS